MRVVGRLAPGVTLDAAREEFGAFMRRALAERNSALAPHLRGVARPFADEVLGDIRPVMRVILAAVALLLLVTCVNVANLMLIRAAGRSSELAVRVAMGATRGRIVRQLLSEGIVLAAFGAVGGVLVAAGALHAIVAFAPPELPRIAGVRLDGASFAAAAVISSLAVVLFALGPALSVAGADLYTALRSGAMSITASRRSRVGRKVLVVVQIALTLVVLSGAGLLARTLDHLQRLDLGFDAEHLAAIEVHFDDDPRFTVQSISDVFDRLSASVTRIHGVVAAAAGIQTPFSNGGIDGWVSAEGQSPTQHTADPFSDLEYVTPAYFRALGIRVVEGRAFDDRAARDASPVVMISESVAAHYWPGKSAIGKRLHCLGGAELCTVIGVVAETHYRDLDRPHLVVYRPGRQAPEPVFAPRVLFVRTKGDPAELLPTIRSLVLTSEPAITLGRAIAVQQLLRAPLAQPRLNALLVAVFAGAALVLASIGIFGVLAFHVAQRTREIGIRHALGARPRELAAMMLREGMTLQVAGIVVGLVLSVVATRSVRALLFGVTPTDPLAFFGASVLLFACGLIGVLIPARRAAQVDPMVALRAE
jgi:putative ABC transport system permease protein